MTRSKPSSHRRRHASIHQPQKPSNTPSRRRRTMALVALLSVLVAVIYFEWKGGLGSRPRHSNSGLPAPKPAGAPPIDAAVTLQLPAEIPGTIELLKEEATTVAERLIAALPARPEAYAQMALLQSESGFADDALQSWEAAVAHDNKFVAAYLAMGIIRAGRAEYGEAAKLLRRAIELDPAAPHAYRELIEVLLKDGQAPEAVAVGREFVRRYPDLAISHFWLGQALLQNGDFAAARSSHQEVIRLSPTWSQPYASLAQACARLGEREEALRHRQRFAELKHAEEAADRQNTRTYDDLAQQRLVTTKVHQAAGELQLRYGDPPVAEAHWLRAAAIAPQDTHSRQSLIAFYAQQARPAAAVRFLEELAEIEPGNSQYLTEEGRCLIDMGRWEDAQSVLERAVTRQPSFAPAHILLAETYLQAGAQLPEARHHAEKAAELSGSPQALLVLAAVLQQEGDLSGARETLRKAVAADPNNQQLRQAYEQLPAAN